MVILYHGKLEEISRDLAEFKPILDRRYEEILGAERAAKVREVAGRVLSPRSFYDDVQQLNKDFGEDLPKDTSNKMSMLSHASFDIAKDGTVKDTKVQTSIAFYISKQGFDHSGSAEFTERPFASYVHEFDHFVWYALQKIPIYTLSQYLIAACDPKPSNNLGEYIGQMVEADVSPVLMNRNIGLYLVNQNLTESFEKANRILDKMVLESIGITAPLPWRHQERKYHLVPTPTGIVQISYDGDPFRRLPDQEAVERFLDFQRYMAVPRGSEYILNLFDSINNLRISRVPVQEMIETMKRRNKKK